MRARTVVVGVVVVGLVGGGACVANRLADGGRVTEVGVDSAIERYRDQITSEVASTTPASTTPASTTSASPTPGSPVPDPTSVTGGDTTDAAADTSTTAPAQTLPAPGVYAYVTVGYDSVDVLTGARHEYPATTTITVTPNGCGVRLRWDVAVERWDSWDWCLDGAGIRLVGWTGFHQFFGVSGKSDYLCSGDPRPLDAEPGTTWELVCRVGDRDASTFRGTVLERTSLVIGGTSVPALHVRYDVGVAGVSTGMQAIEGWYRTTDGLPLRETAFTSTAQQTAVGSTKFEEQSTIELISLTPAS